MIRTPADAANAPNNQEIEYQFAVKAVQHLETYWGLLKARQPRELTLTKLDDDIYEDFKNTFPEYKDTSKLQVLDEDEMKSASGKERWREFMMRYEKSVTDYNFGTILRRDCQGEYTNENTMFVPRMQFIAIELARNRLGLNDWVHSSS